MRGRQLDAVRTRAGFTLADQGLSSLSNFALGVVTARRVSAIDYGVFAIGYSIYGIALGVSRALATDPLVVRFSADPIDVQRAESRGATGTAMAFGAALGAVLVVVGLVVGGSSGAVFIVLGVGLPFLFGQDSMRYVFFMTRRSHFAALNDFVWCAVFLGLLLVPSVRSVTTPAPLIAVWSAAAAAALLIGVIQSRVVPGFHHVWAWVRRHVDLGPRFAAEFIVAAASSHLVIIATAVIAGAAASGAVRGAHVLMGPVWNAAVGLVAAAVPEGVRLKEHALDHLERRVFGLAAMLAALSILWGVITSNFPESVGRAVLGDTWTDAQPLMVVIGIFGGGFVAATGLVSGLRSLAAARRSFAASVPTGLLVIVGGVVGAAVDGAYGAVVGMIFPAWLGAAVVAWQFRAALGDAERANAANP